MKMYRTSGDIEIKTVEIISRTEKTVTVSSYHTGKPRREAIRSEWHEWHETWQQAHDYLKQRSELSRKRYEEMAEAETRRLQMLEAMKQPEDAGDE